MGPKTDEELQRQIEANGGLFEPLLVEPHPELVKKFRIIDGDRRWTNSRVLVEQGKEEYRQIPVEVTDRTLSEEDRLRVWIYIHRQRKEWDAKEKEMVAYRLVDMMGRASAANILGITVRELDKLVEIFELSQKFTSLRDPSAAITWSRELMGVSKKPPDAQRRGSRGQEGQSETHYQLEGLAETPQRSSGPCRASSFPK